MRKILLAVLAVMLVFASLVQAGEPTTTRTKDNESGPYKTYKHTYTATTSLDTVLIANKNGNPVDLGDLAVNRTIYTVAFQSAEGTATNVDKVVEWQVSAVSDAATGISDALDWVTIESDSINNATAAVHTFDAASYKGMRLRALLRDTQDTTDTAVAEEVYFTVPTK